MEFVEDIERAKLFKAVMVGEEGAEERWENSELIKKHV
jgi:hypothetical protein